MFSLVSHQTLNSNNKGAQQIKISDKGIVVSLGFITTEFLVSKRSYHKI